MNCFTSADNTDPGVICKIFQAAPPPAFDWESNDTYAFYPLHACGIFDHDAMKGSTSSIELWPSVWANRRNDLTGVPGTKPNYVVQIPVGAQWTGRVEYTSYQLANVATKAALMAVCGETIEDIEAAAVAGGFAANHVVTWEWAAQQAGAFFTQTPLNSAYNSLYRVKRNWIVLPKGYPFNENFEGIRLDYEVQHYTDSMIASGAARQAANSALGGFADYVHSKGKKIILWSNPINGSAGQRNGIFEANADYLFNKFDYMSLMVWNGVSDTFDKQYTKQLNMIDGVTLNKIMVTVGIGGATLADATALRNKMEQFPPAALWFWRHQAVQGGDCSTLTNKIIRRLAIGQ